ncbi:MAG: hypothetical protein ABI813_10130 [Bacteroidota bacterium]
MMIAALLFLTTANYWVYGCKKEKQTISSLAGAPEEEQDGGARVPNPVEEKNANGLQNLSEYLHEHHTLAVYPVSIRSFGNRHDIVNLPTQHPEFITPPPKQHC